MSSDFKIFVESSNVIHFDHAAPRRTRIWTYTRASDDTQDDSDSEALSIQSQLSAITKGEIVFESTPTIRPSTSAPSDATSYLLETLHSIKDPFFPAVSEDFYKDGLHGKSGFENTPVLQTQPSNHDQSVRADTGLALISSNENAMKPGDGAKISTQSYLLLPISQAFPRQAFPQLVAPAILSSEEMTLDQFCKLFEQTPFDALEILKVLDSTRIQVNVSNTEHSVVKRGLESMYNQLLSHYLNRARLHELKALATAFKTSYKQVS